MANPGAPKVEVMTARFFAVCCKHYRHCANERIHDCKETLLERVSVTAQKLAKRIMENDDTQSKEALKLIGVQGSP